MTLHADAAAPLFDALAEELAADGVEVGTLFGHRSLTSGGKGFACLDDDTVVFRLPAGTEAHEAALAFDGAHLFDPSLTGRTMKDWVVVPVATREQWGAWASEARAALVP